MELIVIWVLLAITVAYLASRRGHSALFAFFMSILVSPMLWGAFEMIRKRDADANEGPTAGSRAMKKCPACAKLVSAEMMTCGYCGETLAEGT